jgi:hypothetical protein
MNIQENVMTSKFFWMIPAIVSVDQNIEKNYNFGFPM